MAEQPKNLVEYDFENDILALSRPRKTKASIEVLDFVIDIDMKGFVCGIEILNASKTLNISKKILHRITKASMHESYNNSCVYIYLVLATGQQEKERLTIPLKVDLGHSTVMTNQKTFVSPQELSV